ncbi:tripartite tricarboxylate transporter TctB family protein [Caenimonas koreensis DSM 17982]|uniref:Tripartite tricarboxylate transporter TctB family protein n=1 Tax=Caenimonas koreensis DSM 17982 TaxID=1121255 RepID=A0A844B7C4_9BURK|nr:tripartite tricarboxylate transporter TctB family protein [Caenimonas koreensis]MRD47296.1 tripartite tricarboxylate transporter TctB family protein [Caenimonas koreensis DSM 17982]
MEEQEIQPERTGVANYVVEAVVATLIMLLGLLVLQGSWSLGSKWTSDGPGSGYFPFYIGLLMCIAGAGALYQALMAKERDMEVFVDRAQLRRVLQVLIPAVIYVLAVQVIGLYVASAIYIAGFMIVLGKYSPVKSVITAVCINVVFFLMFEVWFKVPLFKGMFDPLHFLGY